MEERPYDEIDDLFRQIRLRLVELRDIAPEAVDGIKSSLTQLEDWVEKLVIDSLRLKSLQSAAKKPARTSARAPARKRPPGKAE